MRSILSSLILLSTLAGGTALAAVPKNVAKQWSASERGNQQLHSKVVFIKLKGAALADYRIAKNGGTVPEVIRLKTGTAVAKKTFAIRSHLEELTFVSVYDRKTHQPIAYGHENGETPRIYWRKP